MRALVLPSLLALAATALVATAPAAAATPWTPVTPPSDNLTQMALARTGDGILHVVWPNADKTELDATTIAPGLTVGTSTPIVSGWSSLGNAALLASADGLRVFWSGDHTGADDDPQHGIDTATALPDGSAWTVAPARIDPGGPAFTSDVSAAPVSHAAIESYSGTVGVFVHAGLDSTVAPGEFQSVLGGCCGQDSSVATDDAGDGVIAWASNATGASGVVVQHVDLASGTPSGSPTILDQSADGDNFVPTGSHVALATRPGAPGFLIAYPTGFPTPDVVRLWRVGGDSQVVSSGGAAKTQVALSSTADGRVWVVWGEESGGNVVVRARRSNRTASVFGATVTLSAPAGTGTLYHLAADPEPSGALDALGHFASATDPSATTYAALFHPGLTLTVSRRALRDGRHVRVTARVSDAGDPVAHASIEIASVALHTNAHGLARIVLTRSARRRLLRVAASMVGYTTASTRLRLAGLGR